MFQTFHLEPIDNVLCIKLGLWVHWWGLLHLPNYCAHMCTIIFGRGIGIKSTLVFPDMGNKIPLIVKQIICFVRRSQWHNLSYAKAARQPP